jgi:2',3'-cyclic-nucleotide 2'-phosphodiesterase/3'-nucleotidase
VSANLSAAEGEALAPPWVLLARDLPGSDGRRHRVRIGVLGLGPPQVAGWTATALGGALRARDILEAAREEIPRLRAAGADLVVALCHSGIGRSDPEPLMEDAALPLAALPGLDALIVGHTHEVFPNAGRAPSPALDPLGGTLHGKPAVQPGFFGRQVGCMDLELRHRAEGWSVARHRVQVLSVPPDASVDRAAAAAAEAAHRRLLAITRRPVGMTRVPLHSHFAVIGHDPSLDVVADAKRAEARHLLRDRPEADLPILCTTSPFKSGGRAGPGNYIDIAPGPIAFRQAADLYIYPNTFSLLEITGRGLRYWLDRSAALFNTLTTGREDQPLLDPGSPSYLFDTIDGLTWAFDLGRPPRTDGKGRVLDPEATRVLDLRHDGRPVGDGDRFVLATSSYRLNPGAGFLMPDEVRPLLRTPTPTRDLVIVHVRAGPVDPAPRPRWRFAPLPGTSAWFDSGPGATAHLGELRGRAVEPMGPTPEGFQRFRLRL